MLLPAIASARGLVRSMDNFGPAYLDVSRPYPSARYVTTQQDHFDPDNTATWQQAYYVNDTFWVPGSDAPIFLCVGGEGPALTGAAVVASVHCSIASEWLQQKRSLMFALEHRYYGCHNISACPVTNFSDQLAAFKFLSSRQAIEDIANFIRIMNAQYGLSSNRWVTWGGSYPGMLAGWSRLKHPELIHASVASSAPVWAQLDMPEYNDIVAAAYSVSDNGVGGSPACEAAIRKGHQVIGELLRTEGGQIHLEKMFELGAGSLKTKEGQLEFAGNGVASFPAQSNDPTCTVRACNIGKICEIMLDKSYGNELQRLVTLRQEQRSVVGDRVGERRGLHGVPWDDFWTWQTCTEFGFYQTCETNSSCFYTQGLLTLDVFTSECLQKWGIKASLIEASVEATNAHYGGLRPNGPDGQQLGTCVMWPNGEVDPWAGLSVLTAPSSSQPVLWVSGASHHFWTHPAKPDDQRSVKAARVTIRRQVEQFLQQDCSLAAEVLV